MTFNEESLLYSEKDSVASSYNGTSDQKINNEKVEILMKPTVPINDEDVFTSFTIEPSSIDVVIDNSSTTTLV